MGSSVANFCVLGRSHWPQPPAPAPSPQPQKYLFEELGLQGWGMAMGTRSWRRTGAELLRGIGTDGMGEGHSELGMNSWNIIGWLRETNVPLSGSWLLRFL